MLSVIVPCYNEENSLAAFNDALLAVLCDMPEKYEVVYVDDGSRDGTIELLKRFSEENPSVKIVQFSRNFGKEAALYAGLQHAKGDYLCLIDADLQQPPRYIPDMYAHLADPKGGYDVVAMYPAEKIKSRVYAFFRGVFHFLFKRIGGLDLSHGASDFRMFTREVADALLSVTENSRFTKGIFVWVGFDTLYLKYEPVDRLDGKSRWSFSQLFWYGIGGIVSFSNTPLRLASFTGVFFCAVAFIYLIVTVIHTIIAGVSVPGYASLIVSIMFFGGLQLLVLGIIGEYLANTYSESKSRPIYIARKKLHVPSDIQNKDLPHDKDDLSHPPSEPG